MRLLQERGRERRLAVYGDEQPVQLSPGLEKFRDEMLEKIEEIEEIGESDSDDLLQEIEEMESVPQAPIRAQESFITIIDDDIQDQSNQAIENNKPANRVLIEEIAESFAEESIVGEDNQDRQGHLAVDVPEVHIPTHLPPIITDTVDSSIRDIESSQEPGSNEQLQSSQDIETVDGSQELPLDSSRPPLISQKIGWDNEVVKAPVIVISSAEVDPQEKDRLFTQNTMVNIEEVD